MKSRYLELLSEILNREYEYTIDVPIVQIHIGPRKRVQSYSINAISVTQAVVKFETNCM